MVGELGNWRVGELVVHRNHWGTSIISAASASASASLRGSSADELSGRAQQAAHLPTVILNAQIQKIYFTKTLTGMKNLPILRRYYGLANQTPSLPHTLIRA